MKMKQGKIMDGKILDVLMVLFSAQIIRTYLEAFDSSGIIQSKKQKWVCWGIYLVFQYVVMISHAAWPMFILLCNIFLVFLIHRACCSGDWKAALFHSGIYYAMWMLIEVMAGIILLVAGIGDEEYFFVVGSIVTKIVMYVLTQILKHICRPSGDSHVTFIHWFQLLLVPVATIFIIHNTYCITSKNGNGMFFSLTVMLLLMINYISFEVYDQLGKQADLERRNLVYEQQITLCNRQAAERENAYQESCALRHDLKDYLISLQVLLDAGETEKVREEIECMLEENRIYRKEVSHCGNIIVDSLINYKYSLAQNEGISMKCQIQVPETLPYEGTDLCIIMGNLLDNAIEAVRHLPAEKQEIDLVVKVTKGILKFIVENPYQGSIKENRQGQILTGKKDSQNHGIGLSSVRRAVEKYNGELTVQYEENIFRTMVMLYLPENLPSKA